MTEISSYCFRITILASSIRYCNTLIAVSDLFEYILCMMVLILLSTFQHAGTFYSLQTYGSNPATQKIWKSLDNVCPS